MHIADVAARVREGGALDEEAFLSRCITCGACSASCPTGVISSDFGRTGLNGLFTPVLIMRHGWCEPSCIRCGEVCPTAALTPLTPELKQAIGAPAEVRVGTAFMDRGRCLPWAMDIPCIVCEEMCPTSPKAIELDTVEKTRSDGSRVVLIARPPVSDEQEAIEKDGFNQKIFEENGAVVRSIPAAISNQGICHPAPMSSSVPSWCRGARGSRRRR